MTDDIYVAKESGVISIEGVQTFIVAGKTTVREAHRLYRDYPHLFAPLRVDYDVPPVGEPAEPPHAAAVKRQDPQHPPVSPVRADQQGARTRAGGTK